MIIGAAGGTMARAVVREELVKMAFALKSVLVGLG